VPCAKWQELDPSKGVPMALRSTLLVSCCALATIAAAAEDKTPVDDKPAYHGGESVADCMKRWDAGTHMTKSQWRATCERVRAERLPYLKSRGHVE